MTTDGRGTASAVPQTNPGWKPPIAFFDVLLSDWAASGACPGCNQLQLFGDEVPICWRCQTAVENGENFYSRRTSTSRRRP